MAMCQFFGKCRLRFMDYSTYSAGLHGYITQRTAMENQNLRLPIMPSFGGSFFVLKTSMACLPFA